MLVLVDGSYFCFYRYHALVNWWRLAKSGETHIGNPEFMEKFKKICSEHIQKNILKKTGGTSLLFAKDCKREEIWRNAHIPDYKAGRKPPAEDMSPFFAAVYEICAASGIRILSHAGLEADDCIAIFAKHALSEGDSVTIVTSDRDYFQLPSEIAIFNMAFKNIGCGRDPAFELFSKIVLGDKSDNIKGIFRKCGPKTVEKYFKDRLLFEEQIKRENCECLFALNTLLVDFNSIPTHIVDEYKNNNIVIK